MRKSSRKSYALYERKACENRTTHSRDYVHFNSKVIIKAGQDFYYLSFLCNDKETHQLSPTNALLRKFSVDKFRLEPLLSQLFQLPDLEDVLKVHL